MRLAIIGRIMQRNFELLGSRKEFVIVTLLFLVGCFVKHYLWEQSSRSGCEIELIEAGC